MESILITGNMGYVGSCAVPYFRRRMPDAKLIGLDQGFFAAALMKPPVVPETSLDRQYFGDVRDVQEQTFQGVDAVVHLAAISNDPMGNKYEAVTEQINEQATIALATKAKRAGAKSFVFASSCSVYGFAQEQARTEQSSVNPLTAYARSKVNSEMGLRSLADEHFKVTCLRFATACGFSPRLRLDLVLNDFVAAAITEGTIRILSDGSPWRPLIDVMDMARAMEWAVCRPLSDGGPFLVVNTGTDQWNYQVKQLAEAVAEELPGTTIDVNSNAAPDKRSYRVDFGLFRKLAPGHQPAVTLKSSIERLRAGLQVAGFQDRSFRNSNYMRLNMLSQLRDEQYLDPDLRWLERQVAHF